MRTALFLALVACGGAPTETSAPEAAPAPAAEEAPEATPEVAEAAHDEPEAEAARVVDGWEVFGAEHPIDGDALAAADLLADPTSHVGQTVLVEGEVADVCQKAGCWMVVRAGERTMRVLMKDHAFSVAKDGAGATARIHGEVTAKAVKQEDVEHFASEAGKPDLVPEKQATDGTTYELVASTVAFKRS